MQMQAIVLKSSDHWLMAYAQTIFNLHNQIIGVSFNFEREYHFHLRVIHLEATQGPVQLLES